MSGRADRRAGQSQAGEAREVILALCFFLHRPVIEHRMASAPEPHVYQIHCDKGDKHRIKAERGLPKDGIEISGKLPMRIDSPTPIAWFEIDGRRRKVKQ